ncbi:MAG: diadenylate cyclase CdaA [Clostridia bacterium]|nr:diadenylate cyclase CdaA [Clostridia bacterium]
MQSVLDSVAKIWGEFFKLLKYIRVWDVIDILIVTVLVYYIYKFIRDRRAGKLAIGILFILAVTAFSQIFNLITLKYIMQNVFQIGFLAIVIIFQPELRTMLENVAGDSLKGLRNISEQKDKKQVEHFISEICNAVSEMAMSRTGALIVIEGTSRLGDVIASGTLINADTSSLLLRNIFFNKSPLHDGAVIIRDMKICAAGCILPISTTLKIDPNLGTRHRSAISMSADSDAYVIVVSEETGVVSVASKGTLRRNYDNVKLKVELENMYNEMLQSRRVKLGKRKNASQDNGSDIKTVFGESGDDK